MRSRSLLAVHSVQCIASSELGNVILFCGYLAVYTYVWEASEGNMHTICSILTRTSIWLSGSDVRPVLTSVDWIQRNHR